MFLDPDARMQLYGPDGLADHELLAFLLTRGGAPGPEAIRTARDVLVMAGALGALPTLGEAELVTISGVGPARARRIRALAALSRRLAERPLPRGAVVDDPRLVYESCRGRLAKADQERMLVLLLDSRLRKLGEREVARGSSNAVFVAPREVFRAAVRENASAVVVVHNHPSGDPTPSEEDLRLTRLLVEAGRALGIEVLDHLVVVDGGYVSIAEAGLMDGLASPWPGPARSRGPRLSADTPDSRPDTRGQRRSSPRASPVADPGWPERPVIPGR